MDNEIRKIDAVLEPRRTEVFNLSQNLAALIAYVPILGVNIISSIVWLRTEKKDNRFLRFHATQSLVLCACYFGLGLSLFIINALARHIPVVGPITGLLSKPIWWIASLCFLGANIVSMIEAYSGRAKQLPFVGRIADQFVR